MKTIIIALFVFIFLFVFCDDAKDNGNTNTKISDTINNEKASGLGGLNSKTDTEFSSQQMNDKLRIPIGDIAIVFSNMYGAPKVGVEEVQENDTLRFELGIIGIDGYISDAEIEIENASIDDVSIKERYCSTFIFNEDGSGGTWTIPKINGNCSEWVAVEPTSASSFKAHSMSKSEPFYPHLSEDDVSIAKEYCAKQQNSVSYFEFVHLAEFKVSADNITKIIIFDITAGD